MSTVTHLSEFRARKGLPPSPHDERPMLERVLVRFRQHDGFSPRGVLPPHAFKQVAMKVVRRFVQQIEAGDLRVADDARFQFFGIGLPGIERLQMRVNRVGPKRGKARALLYEVDPASLALMPLDTLGTDGELKPLLTLPMTDFYRLR